jgi:Family of unknown function (DUF6065)
MSLEGNSNNLLEITAYITSPFKLPVVPAPAFRDWMTQTDASFAYRCLPLLIANQSGWVVLNSIPITVTWTGGIDSSSVVIDYRKGLPLPLVKCHFGSGILTWSIPYLFRTPPGFNLLVRGPANYPKDGVYPLEGVVETDWSSASFTMNWKITRPNTPIHFEVDEPICMIVPQRRGELEVFEPKFCSIESCPEQEEQHKQWSTKRREYLKNLKSGTLDEQDPGWQRHYFQGTHISGEKGSEAHQTKLYLRPFEED